MLTKIKDAKMRFFNLKKTYRRL